MPNIHSAVRRSGKCHHLFGTSEANAQSGIRRARTSKMFTRGYLNTTIIKGCKGGKRSPSALRQFHTSYGVYVLRGQTSRHESISVNPG